MYHMIAPGEVYDSFSQMIKNGLKIRMSDITNFR